MAVAGPVDLGSVLALFGREAISVAEIGEGRVNRHWRVETADGPLVLRRYRPDRSAAAIAWEHALLRHAAGRGWPVARPLRTEARATFVERGGALFALFPWLRGEPEGSLGPARYHVQGRLLARLHSDLEDLDAGQRPGFGRAWELDLFVHAAGEESFNALLARFTAEHPELGRAVRAEKYRNLRELARLGYGDLPDVNVHADFRAEHLLYEGGALSGLLDFDLARRDAAMFDIACSLTLGPLEGPPFDPAAAANSGAFLQGYAAGRPVSEREARLLVPLLRAAQLWLVMFPILQWRDGSARAAASIARTVEHRLPALRARAADLEAAALAAAQRG